MIVIIGAGISGLSLAWHLEQNKTDYLVLEASDEVGGYLRSVRDGEYLFEEGANSLLMDSEIEDFIRQVRFENNLIKAKDISKSRFIVRGKVPKELPSSPPKLLFNNFFSARTKLKIAKEYFRKSEDIKENTTVGAFLESHFGKEVVDYAVSPFVTGIYAADPYELLLSKTFPVLREYTLKYGSVLKGFIKNRPTERKASVSFRDGLQSFAKHIASQVNVKKNSPVLSLEKEDNLWKVQLENKTLDAHQVILTTPALPTARLLKEQFPALSEAVENLDYPPMCLIHSVFKKKDVGFELNGFGALHPKKEDTFSAGAIWSSSVFESRTPDDEVLFTGFVGGKQWAKNALLPEKEILEKHTKEIKQIYRIQAEPVLQRFKRWEKSVPQYNEKLLELDKRITSLDKSGLHILANWYQGVSIGDCIKKAAELSKDLLINEDRPS